MDALALLLTSSNGNSNDKLFDVACVYRPPSGNINEFVNKFRTYVHDITFKHITTYICGDFNIDLLKYSSHKGSVQSLIITDYN